MSPDFGHIDEGAQLAAGEAALLGGGLGLDKAAVLGHNDIHVHIGRGILLVAKIEQRRAADDANRGGGYQLPERGALQGSGLDQSVEGQGQGDGGAGDGGGARAAVGLDDVAVEDDSSFAEGLMSTTERKLRPMRRWISWVRPPILPRSLSLGVRVTVERGSIEYSAVTQPRPELRSQPGTPCSMVALVRTRVLPKRDQDGALGGLDKAGNEGERAELGGGSASGTEERSRERA